MDLLENAVKSIELGVEDYRTGTHARLLSAVRNIHAGILLLYKEALRRLSPSGSNDVLMRSSLAYVLLVGLRRLGLQGTQWARAQTETIRRGLLKIGALVKVSVRRMYLSLASGYPYEEAFAAVYRALRPPGCAKV